MVVRCRACRLKAVLSAIPYQETLSLVGEALSTAKVFLAALVLRWCPALAAMWELHSGTAKPRCGAEDGAAAFGRTG
jgi:hypothetical protein